MTLMVKCKFCNFESDELQWDKAYHDSTGKWRLFHEGQGRPHDCRPKPEEPVKMVKCPKCDPMTRKAMSAKKLQEHIKKEHIDWGNY